MKAPVVKRRHTCGPRILCGARLQKHPGRHCRAWAMTGKKRCRIHGAKSTGPRPRFDENGNYIVTNREARDAGFRRWVERRRLIRAAMKAASRSLNEN